MQKVLLTALLALACNTTYAAKPDCKININTASSAEISDCLNGFGEKKAVALVEARKSGDFLDLSDLKTRVVGVGDKTLEKNVDRICFNDSCLGKTDAVTDASSPPPTETPVVESAVTPSNTPPVE